MNVAASDGVTCQCFDKCPPHRHRCRLNTAIRLVGQEQLDYIVTARSGSGKRP